MMNLKNTKVYTRDHDIIRKYAELCGFSCGSELLTDISSVGVGFNLEEIFKLYKNSFYAILLTEVTPEQINKMHAEKFGQVESPEEKEALDAIKEIDLDYPVTKIKIGENESVGFRIKGSESNVSPEWKIGDKCITGSGEKIYIAPYPFEKDIHILADEHCVHRAHISVIKKPESPEQKAERERDEKAKQIMIDICGDEVFKSRDWDYHKRFSHNAKMAFQLVDLGYCKEK